MIFYINANKIDRVSWMISLPIIFLSLLRGDELEAREDVAIGTNNDSCSSNFFIWTFVLQKKGLRFKLISNRPPNSHEISYVYTAAAPL